jgi:hypothetical protein
VVAEIRRFYEELNKFWTEEIHCVVEALRKKGRTDPKDLERWNNFHSGLKQTVESWKVYFPPFNMYSATDPSTVFRIGHQTVTLKPYAATIHALLQFVDSPSTLSPFLIDCVQGVDLGAIASSLSPTIGSLEEALERMSSSTSLKHSQLGRPLFQRVYVSFAANSGLCLSFLQHCTVYGEKMFAWCHFSVALLASPLGVPSNLRERITGLRSEVTDVSTENAASAQGAQGLSSYRSMPMSPIADRCGHFYLLLRAMDIQKYLQQSPDLRTEDHFWVDPRIERPARESLFLGRNHGWPFR